MNKIDAGRLVYFYRYGCTVPMEYGVILILMYMMGFILWLVTNVYLFNDIFASNEVWAKEKGQACGHPTD